MNHIKNAMIQEYHMTNEDWLGYLVRSGKFDYHHLIKKEDGGQITRDNGAILGHMDHQYLHVVEYKDIERYWYLNKILKQINQQGYMPTKNQLIAIHYALEEFEREHCSDVNAKGQPLIREEYTKRLIRRKGL